MLWTPEDLILDECCFFFFVFRVYAWRVQIQRWGILRFSDNRGVSPTEHFDVDGNGLVARLQNHWSRRIPEIPNCGRQLSVLRSHGELALSQMESPVESGRTPKGILSPSFMPQGNYKTTQRTLCKHGWLKV